MERFWPRMPSRLLRSSADQRMVDGTQEEAICIWRKRANRRLNGAELATLPVGVDDDLIFGERHLRRNCFGVLPQDDSPHNDVRMPGDVKQMLKEGATLVGKQSFRRPHAARSTTRQNHGGEHWTTPVAEKRNAQKPLATPPR